MAELCISLESMVGLDTLFVAMAILQGNHFMYHDKVMEHVPSLRRLVWGLDTLERMERGLNTGICNLATEREALAQFFKALSASQAEWLTFAVDLVDLVRRDSLT